MVISHRVAVLLIAVFWFCDSTAAQTIDEIVEPTVVPAERAVPLAGTAKLEMTGDIASQLVEGVDQFLLRKLAESPQHREKYWKRDSSSAEAYAKSVEPNRARLAKMIGLVEERTKNPRIEVISPPGAPVEIAQNEFVKAYEIRWPVFGQVHGEGILLAPRIGEVRGNVIAVPDCDQSPEGLAGLTKELGNFPWALWLAHQGFEVAIPQVIGRTAEARNGRAVMTHREFVYRSSFELGRHPLGYDVAKVIALIDAGHFKKAPAKLGVAGVGDGGFIAMLSAAIDQRVDATFVGGFFGPRENSWNEPIDRNLFGFLREFGCAEVATLIAPRKLFADGEIYNAIAPLQFDAGQGGAPFVLLPPKQALVVREFNRALELLRPLKVDLGFGGRAGAPVLSLNDSMGTEKPKETASGRMFERFAMELGVSDKEFRKSWSLERTRENRNAGNRHARQMEELVAHNESVLVKSPYARKEFLKSLKTDSIENFKQTIEPYRKHFEEETIGKFDDAFLPLNPRTRLAYETDKWKGYEVVLDIFPEVFAYGILIVPNDLKEGEKRPVVVCQHGLEGRPQDLIGKKGFDAYKAFAGRLAERGFITFAPQNLYIFGDRFRTLQRKANPLGKTLFSIIVPQHQQIVKWLGEQNFVDKDRIAFYGLSYGGKSAMRIPPLVPEYCLSICSADFNEWVWKNASTKSPYSYVWTNEYEIFEWDLGSTFNYAEMAALIAPRPFMVERGHFDGVAPDETVAYEFAKVKHLYHAQLKLPEDACQIEFFVGPHTINGKGSFEFLHRHLAWPAK
jgi:dienelactone hydrolase